ncbi:MAG: diguanylate cyclase [Gammaproteobacteria bacterium]|nr:diguanylate cyclase [Gammaproteobacteria bacterium]
MTGDNHLLFSKKSANKGISTTAEKKPWNIMVVDDDEGIHKITALVLRKYHFQDRATHLIHAYTAKQAWELLKKNPDTALIILDVVMETDKAGLELVGKIRNSLKNNSIRILLRTGQPGRFNEYEIASKYDINQYKEKSVLTTDKLLACITTLLREYSTLLHLHKQKNDLEKSISNLSSIARMFEESGIAALVLDSHFNIVSMNSAFSEITGYDSKFILGKTPECLYSNKNNQALLHAAWNNLLDSGSWEGELWCATKSGNDINIHLSVTIMNRADGAASDIAVQFSNVTQINERRSQLIHWATHDELTSLPNRHLFFYDLDEAIANAERSQSEFALFFIDLDYFKNINDSMGHKYGDQLLKLVSERLHDCIRKSDTLARVGGDEFAVIIHNFTSIKQVETTAKKINNALARPFNLDNREASIAGSVGIALYPHDAVEADQLYHLADLAMYQAKHNGRSTYCFYSSSIKPE